MTMDFKDITPEIAEVAKSYRYHQSPDLLVKLQERIASALRWLNDWLSSFRITIPGPADTKIVGNLMQLILLAAGLIGAAVLLWLVWVRLSQIRKAKAAAKRAAASAELVLDAGGWRQEAQNLASREDWRGACRALYLSLLRLLDELRVASFAPTKTNYEYWYALSAYPAIQKGFRELASRVELVWFGSRLATKPDYDLCLAKLGEMEDELKRLAETANQGMRP